MKPDARKTLNIFAMPALNKMETDIMFHQNQMQSREKSVGQIQAIAQKIVSYRQKNITITLCSVIKQHATCVYKNNQKKNT